MGTLLEILEFWSLGVLGTVFYVVFTAYNKFQDPSFKIVTFLNQHKGFWIVSVLLHLLIAVIMAIEPGLKDTIQNLGFAVGQTRAAWILLGVNLAAGTNRTLPNKITKAAKEDGR